MEFIVSLFDIKDLDKYYELGIARIVCGYKQASLRSVVDFDEAMLLKIKQECNKLNIKLNILCNRFYHDDELALMHKQLAFLKRLDPDGIYFGDEAILYEAKRMGMVDKLIYLPDTLLCNQHDCEYYLNQGMKYVSLSKEITQDEIIKISQALPNKIELLIHGRVLMMHSKRNLLTSYEQFVKLPHKLHNEANLALMEEHRDGKMPVFEDEFGTHIFSAYTLNSFKQIELFKNNGIKYVKIDGIFHDSNWIIQMVKYYQAILNHEQNCEEVLDDYANHYPSDCTSEGFYHQATSKLKEGNA